MSEKWAELMTLLKDGGSQTVLRVPGMSSVIPGENILAQQMNGPGQIVECSHQSEGRKVVVSFVNIYEENWLVAGFQDLKK